MTGDVAWAQEHLATLRLGRRLAAEVAGSGPGRRAFVGITPGRVEADEQARRPAARRARTRAATVAPRR